MSIGSMTMSIQQDFDYEDCVFFTEGYADKNIPVLGKLCILCACLCQSRKVSW